VPPTVKYKHQLIEAILQQEQHTLISIVPADFIWPVLRPKAPQTVNSAARRYKVNLDNGLWMNIVARQKKVLRLEINTRSTEALLAGSYTKRISETHHLLSSEESQ
jgi:hypothetical protein